jgi:hypothetical protein
MGSVNCTLRRAYLDEQSLPSRVVSLQPNADEVPASKDIPRIVHLHNPFLGQQPPILQPPIIMNAARPGVDQRNVPPRRPIIIDLVSDDEEDYDDDDQDVTLSPSSLTPSLPEMRQPRRDGEASPVLGNLPANNRPPSPAGPANSPGAFDPWENAINIDDDLRRFEDFDDLDIRDADLELLMMEQYNQMPRPQAALPVRDQAPPRNQENERPAARAEPQPEPRLETKVDCVDAVVALFPGICRDHVSNLYETISPTSDHMIAHILDRMDKGESYPSAKEITKSLKRKRDIDEDEEAVRKYGAVDRVVDIRGNIRQFM